jgi:hypothetical protein
MGGRLVMRDARDEIEKQQMRSSARARVATIIGS